MLKVRVIPTLLWKNVGLVKGVAFDSWRRVGTVLPAIKVYNARDVDELFVADISATAEGRGPNARGVADFASFCFVPLTVGGGVRSVDDAVALLRAGADKVALNTAALEQPELIGALAARFGVQCVVASIDVRGDRGAYEAVTRSGRTPTGRDPVSLAVELQDRGAGEILLTSIERDGTMKGYDLALIEAVASRVTIPVIASGGAGSYADMIAAIRDGGASAVAAASMFHFTEQTPLGAKRALADAGLPVRLPATI